MSTEADKAAVKFARQRVMAANKEFTMATTPGVRSYWAGRLKQERAKLAAIRSTQRGI